VGGEGVSRRAGHASGRAVGDGDDPPAIAGERLRSSFRSSVCRLPAPAAGRRPERSPESAAGAHSRLYRRRSIG
jgi:hypothetical protein